MLSPRSFGGPERGGLTGGSVASCSSTRRLTVERGRAAEAPVQRSIGSCERLWVTRLASAFGGILAMCELTSIPLMMGLGSRSCGSQSHQAGLFRRLLPCLAVSSLALCASLGDSVVVLTAQLVRLSFRLPRRLTHRAFSSTSVLAPTGRSAVPRSERRGGLPSLSTLLQIPSSKTSCDQRCLTASARC
jgi:hypothetical protein